MKTRIMILSMVVSTNAMALDFDVEWAKFKDDFTRLRSSMTSSKPEVVVTPVPPLVPVDDADVKLVDPKSKDRLGLSLSNPQMRNKLKDLYSKPDTIVYSTTVR